MQDKKSKVLTTSLNVNVFIGLLLLSVVFLVASQASSGQARELLASETAEYRVVFNATWDPPPGDPVNPHFSGLVGGTHNSNGVYWRIGSLASPGIKNMAETGGKDPLRQEIGDDPNSDKILSGGNIPNSPGSAEVSSFTADLDFPLVTLVSMIAPSPDWFVGVSGLSLVDQNGEWINEITVELFPYDAGTDDGPDFSSGNDPSNPAVSISRINDDNLFPNLPLGTFTFTRIDEPDPTLTPTATATAVNTVVPTATATVVNTVVPTATATPVNTVVPTATATPVNTVVPTPTTANTPVPTATPAEPFVATDFVYLPIVLRGE